MTNAKHTIELPALFYDDHSSRMSDKDPTEPAYSDVVIKRKAKTVVISACDEALAEIESDADYYASMLPGDMEPEYNGVIRSAKATLTRIAKYRKAMGE